MAFLRSAYVADDIWRFAPRLFRFRPVKIAPPIQVRQSSVKPISSTLGAIS